MRHKNRTLKGDALVREHQSRYEKMLLGKSAKCPTEIINGLPLDGTVVGVKYIGNSVYGVVRVDLDNGATKLVGGNFRPTKEDFYFIVF